MAILNNKNAPKTAQDKNLPVPGFVTALLNLMNELIQVMVQENDLVLTRSTKEHALLLQRKQRLTIDYRASMKSLEAQPDVLKTLPDEIRQALRTAANKLSDVADRNARTLRSAVVATQRLLQNIISMIRLEALPKSSYKNPQTAHLQLGGYNAACKSVAISRTV